MSLRHVAFLSATGEPELRRLAAELARADPNGRTRGRPRARRGRSRMLATGTGPAEVADRLARYAAGIQERGVRTEEHERAPFVAFAFSGQGSLRTGMGGDLHARSSTFRSVVDRCDEAVERAHGRGLRELFHGRGDRSLLGDARFAQPALYALQCALCATWGEWDVVPCAVTGHSLGEYAAACAAGTMELEDGLALVIERGRLTQDRVRDGVMAVVLGEPGAIQAVLGEGGHVAIAAVNAPGVVAISGPEAHVAEARASLEAQGMTTRDLDTTHPFHSSCVEPMLPGLELAAGRMTARVPRILFASTLEGRLLAWDERPGAAYWRRHAREPVRFQEAVRTLERLGCTHVVEIGPHATLTRLGERCSTGRATTWLPSLQHGRRDEEALFEAAAALWLAGVDVPIARVAHDLGGRCLADADAGVAAVDGYALMPPSTTTVEPVT